MQTTGFDCCDAINNDTLDNTNDEKNCNSATL